MSDDLEQRIRKLEIIDERREKHYQTLFNSFESLKTGQADIIHLLGGSPLNGNKGIVKLIEKIESKVDILEADLIKYKEQADTARAWGRGAMGFLFAILLVIINYIKDKI